MDGSPSMPTSKKAKLFNDGDAEDRISCLPDNVLHHILSFLPTKYAVGTSVLSTRWEYLWTSSSKLDFHDDELLYSTVRSIDPMVKRRFMNFVDRVLHLHDATSIHKFYLLCTTDYDLNRVCTWISTVIRCKVQELILSVYSKGPFVFPRCLFNCESLTTLKIKTEEGYLKTRTSICFPNLKVLHLDSVTFCGDPLTQQLSFSFPVLEEFSAIELRWMKINTVHVSAPTLKRLMIDDYFRNTRQAREIIFHVESLMFIELSSSLVCKYVIFNKMSVIEEAILDVPCDSNIVLSLIKFLEGFNNVKYLQLYDRTITSVFPADTFSQLPTFSSLRLTVAINYDGFDARDVIKLLHKMPNIVSIIFSGPYVVEYNEQRWLLEVIPQCMSHLKFVQVSYFNGSELELCLVKYFLKNARILENMSVMSSEELSTDPVKLVEVTKQLLMVPRGSTLCEIDFS